MNQRILTFLIFLGACTIAAPVRAAPEEIQVYLDEFEEPGHFGLDMHTNFVADATPGSASGNMLRVTPELSYGINDHWEAGLYWLTSTGPQQSQGAPVSDGFKVRFKWRPEAPSADSPWYGAVNFELGQLSSRFYPDETSSEVKFIGMWRAHGWTVGANLNFDQSLRPNPLQPGTSLEIDTKIAYRPAWGDEHDWQIGVENYSGIGYLGNLFSADQRTTTTFLVVDFALPGGWDFNVGAGVATGATPDHLIVKAIIGVPI